MSDANAIELGDLAPASRIAAEIWGSASHDEEQEARLGVLSPFLAHC
jgi:hypothetical protein